MCQCQLVWLFSEGLCDAYPHITCGLLRIHLIELYDSIIKFFISGVGKRV